MQRNFLASAEALQNSEDEMAWRNSISRAYYGAYHHALKYAVDTQLPDCNVKTGMHEQLSLRFDQAGRRSESIMLKSMHSKRCQADYKLDQAVNMKEAQVQCQTARRLMAKL
jgi:uncharacterized protein (UPF0332 family)